jgi:hypothetical protein
MRKWFRISEKYFESSVTGAANDPGRRLADTEERIRSSCFQAGHPRPFRPPRPGFPVSLRRCRGACTNRPKRGGTAAALTIGPAATRRLRRESTCRFRPSNARAPSSWRSPLSAKTTSSTVHRKHGVANRARKAVRQLKLEILLAPLDPDRLQYRRVDPGGLGARVDHQASYGGTGLRTRQPTKNSPIHQQ